MVCERKSSKKLPNFCSLFLPIFIDANGYIDETYPDYMTYFYENSLTRIDKMFLRSVTDQKAKEYTYKLKNPEVVLKRLSLASFENKEILNFDLLEYMLNQSSVYVEQLNRLILQLKNNKEYDFIKKFIESDRNPKEFVRVINIYWPQFFSCILNESDYSDELKKVIALLSILGSSQEELASVNEENVLSDFISNRSDFLQIQNPETELIIERLMALKVRFINLEYAISDSDLSGLLCSHDPLHQIQIIFHSRIGITRSINIS